MDDKTKLTGETRFPIPVPSTDMGWEAMRKRLDDEMPEAAAIVTKKDAQPHTTNKLTRLLLLLLLFLVTGFVAVMMSKNKSGKGINPSTIPEKYSANGKPKQDDKLNEENKPVGTIKNNGNAAEPGKKITRHDLSTVEPANKVTTNPARFNKVLPGNKDHTPGLTAAKKVKTTNNRNAFVKNKTSKTGKGKLNTKNQNHDTLLADNKHIAGNRTITSDSVVQKKISSSGTIAKFKTNGEKKLDSIATDTPVPTSNSGWKLDGGGYWNLQVPTAATSSYFLGSNARSQLYRVILPGAWVQAQNEKHLVTFEVNAFASNLIPAKAFRTFTTYENIPDTTIVTVQTRTLRKVFGLSAGLGYGQNISGNWWLGSHLQSFWWRKAVAASNGEIQKYPANGSPAVIIPVKENYTINDEWSYFSNLQFYLNAEGIYREAKWQAGLRMGMAITPLAKNDGPSRSLRLELLYRLKLFNLKMNDERKKAGLWSQ